MIRQYKASAPGRCGIIGNPSDIYGGFVVSCSVPARARCQIVLGREERLPPDRTLWDAATARFPALESADVRWDSDIPRSSGLAGSTALLAATLACLLDSRSTSPDLSTPDARSTFAELVRDVEFREAGVVCGYQDAMMVVHGGLQAMDFAGKHPIGSGPLPQLTPLSTDLGFLLITTGVERLSGSVHGPIRDRWLSGDQVVISTIERITELGRLGYEAIVTNDAALLAETMQENQTLVAELGGSGDAIDSLIGHCLNSGAHAAKLAGAGLGGTVIALADDPLDLQVRLEKCGFTRFLLPQIEPGLSLELTDGLPNGIHDEQ